MIYQMQIYYGAVLNGQVIYSFKVSLDDCTKFPDELNEDTFKYPIDKIILNDGLNVEDFEIRYLTKEEYDNRFDIENEKTIKWSISK